MKIDKQQDYSEKIKDLGPGSYYPKYDSVKPANRTTYIRKEKSVPRI